MGNSTHTQTFNFDLYTFEIKALAFHPLWFKILSVLFPAGKITYIQVIDLWIKTQTKFNLAICFSQTFI